MPECYTPEHAARVEKVLRAELLSLQSCLKIEDEAFARILSISVEDLGRMKSGAIVIKHDSHSRTIGVHFIRMYRVLSTIVGGNEKIALEWLKNPNTVLGDVPLCIIEERGYSGLDYVLQYLDSRSNRT